METVKTNILGREYSLACSVDEKPTLEAAVAHVGQLAGKIQGAGKVSGNEKIAVMVAIQIAAELLMVKTPDGPLGSASVGDFKRKIDDIHAILDAIDPA